MKEEEERRVFFFKASFSAKHHIRGERGGEKEANFDGILFVFLSPFCPRFSANASAYIDPAKKMNK